MCGTQLRDRLACELYHVLRGEALRSCTPLPIFVLKYPTCVTTCSSATVSKLQAMSRPAGGGTLRPPCTPLPIFLRTRRSKIGNALCVGHSSATTYCSATRAQHPTVHGPQCWWQCRRRALHPNLELSCQSVDSRSPASATIGSCKHIFDTTCCDAAGAKKHR